MKIAKKDIQIKYNVPEHSIDINTLANSLNAFSDMVHETDLPPVIHTT